MVGVVVLRFWCASNDVSIIYQDLGSSTDIASTPDLALSTSPLTLELDGSAGTPLTMSELSRRPLTARVVVTLAAEVEHASCGRRPSLAAGLKDLRNLGAGMGVTENSFFMLASLGLDER